MKKPILTALLLLSLACTGFSQLSASLVSATPLTIRISNDHSTDPLGPVTVQWELQVNGRMIRKGSIPLQATTGKNPAVLHIPATPSPNPKDESFLNIRYKSTKTIPPAQILLKSAADPDITVRPNGELTFTDDNGAFIVSSPNCNIRFNKQSGELIHYAAGPSILVDDPYTLKPITTASPRLQLFSTSTSAEIAVVSADYALPGSSWYMHMRYTCNARGEIQISQSFDIDTSQSTLNNQPDTTHNDSTSIHPGMQWSLPPGLDSIQYYGKGHTGIAIYNQWPPAQTQIQTSAIRWYKLKSKDNHGLTITADTPGLELNYTTNPARLTIDHPTRPQLSNTRYIYKITPL